MRSVLSPADIPASRAKRRPIGGLLSSRSILTCRHSEALAYDRPPPQTRLTNGFSKKAENHAYSAAIHFMHYNFVRIHQTLKVTPAMAAKVTPKLWEMADMVAVLEEWETAK